MKKVLRAFFPFAIVLFSSVAIYAQIRVEGLKNTPSEPVSWKVLDNAKYRIFYQMRYTPDSAAADVKYTGQTVLLVGGRYSEFLDYNKLRSDSIENAMAKSGVGSQDIMNRILPISRNIAFSPVVMRNYPTKGVYTFQQKVGLGGLYRYEDKGIKVQWNLEDGERTIEGYQCKKATCTHRGRSYVAWYAPALAMGDGPYVFGGLPGLILELYDTRDHYHFTMNGLQKVEGNDPLYLQDKNVENTTRDEVRKMLVNMVSNPGAILQTLKAQGITYTPSPEAQKRMSKPRPFNPIELE
jgi:hypothetical protein